EFGFMLPLVILVTAYFFWRKRAAVMPPTSGGDHGLAIEHAHRVVVDDERADLLGVVALAGRAGRSRILHAGSQPSPGPHPVRRDGRDDPTRIRARDLLVAGKLSRRVDPSLGARTVRP